jgi:hypothetical protein
LEKIEAAVVAAARDLLTGRRILDVEDPYGLGLTKVEVGNDELCRQPGPDEASAVLSRAVSVPIFIGALRSRSGALPPSRTCTNR